MIQVAIDSKYYLKTNIIDDSDLNWISNDYEDFKKWKMMVGTILFILKSLFFIKEI